MKQATRFLWINLVLLLVALTAQAQTTNPISSLTAIPTAAGGDRLIINQASGSSYTTRQIAVSNLNAGWYSAFVVPQDYGAKGDGSTDDTAALQNWINAASSLQKTALLPPASNNYYKITYPLFITNINGIRIMGGGGIFHNPGPTPSKCQIRQFTAGSPALIVTNFTGSTQPPDSVHITAVAFVNNAYSTDTNSFGIGFVGGAADSDNSSVNYCLISGFRYGLVNAGASILTVQGTTLCNNGDGYYQGAFWENQDPTINAIHLQGCSLTHNYSNSLSIWSGRLVVDSCDLVGERTTHIGSELFMTNATVSLRNVNLEHQSPNLPAYIVLSGANLTVDGGLHQNFGGAGANTYLVAMTNSVVNKNGSVVWNAPAYSMVTTDGFSFIEVNVEAYTYFKSRPQTMSRYILPSDSRTYTNYCENYTSMSYPSLSGRTPIPPGVLQFNRYNDSDIPSTYPVFGGQVLGTNINMNLAQYYLDGLGTVTNRNMYITGSLLAATNAAAANSYGTALWIGTNNAGIGTPWLLVSNGHVNLSLARLGTNTSTASSWSMSNGVLFTTERTTAAGVYKRRSGIVSGTTGDQYSWMYLGTLSPTDGADYANSPTTGQSGAFIQLGSVGSQNTIFAGGGSGSSPATIIVENMGNSGSASRMTITGGSHAYTDMYSFTRSTNGLYTVANDLTLTSGNNGTNNIYLNGKTFISSNLTVTGWISVKPLAASPTNVPTGQAFIFSKAGTTNDGVNELFVAGGDGVETQISPHADDAPPQLYDRTSGDMKEIIWRESNPFITNGLVSFINLRRMARTMELHTRVLLLLGGVTNASTTAALVRLKAMTVAEKQVIATEDFPTYNARTGNTLQSLDWDTVQASVQAAYDLQRANVDLQRTYLTATNAVIQAQISAGDTNATLVALPDPLPVKNVRQAKPAWLN